MGMTGISRSQVSRLCHEIDDKVQTFLTRPIEGSIEDQVALSVALAARFLLGSDCILQVEDHDIGTTCHRLFQPVEPIGRGKQKSSCSQDVLHYIIIRRDGLLKQARRCGARRKLRSTRGAK